MNLKMDLLLWVELIQCHVQAMQILFFNISNVLHLNAWDHQDLIKGW